MMVVLEKVSFKDILLLLLTCADNDNVLNGASHLRALQMKCVAK
jgi:hypothetical protein